MKRSDIIKLARYSGFEIRSRNAIDGDEVFVEGVIITDELDQFASAVIDKNIGPDRNVETVRQMLLDRSVTGLNKYGTTTERTDLTRAQWLRHAQEEALDLAVYLQKLIEAENGG